MANGCLQITCASPTFRNVQGTAGFRMWCQELAKLKQFMSDLPQLKTKSESYLIAT